MSRAPTNVPDEVPIELSQRSLAAEQKRRRKRDTYDLLAELGWKPVVERVSLIVAAVLFYALGAALDVQGGDLLASACIGGVIGSMYPGMNRVRR